MVQQVVGQNKKAVPILQHNLCFESCVRFLNRHTTYSVPSLWRYTFGNYGLADFPCFRIPKKTHIVSLLFGDLQNF